jgi:hypothetical protein
VKAGGGQVQRGNTCRRVDRNAALDRPSVLSTAAPTP